MLCKITVFLFFIYLSTIINAQTKEAKITIQRENITLNEVFTLIEQQSNYSIAYEQSLLDLKRSLSLSIKNVSIEKALKQIIKDTGHTYKITGYHIIIVSLSDKGKEEEEQKPTQKIRGIVIDSKTGSPIEYAMVLVRNYPSLGAVTDSLGRFVIHHVPVGRYDIQVSLVGYDANIRNGVLLTSSKEVFLTLLLNENIHSLAEVIVRPKVDKEGLLNTMAITGGRMISMEEAGRFANGFDDPARLSFAFAGVAGGIGSNAVSIRGNSPQFTQWRLEGVEIPNPTHYADLGGLGGGFLSALSTQVIGNSDFYNGAFPAEYNNALSGIFDMRMRTGNNQKHEHTFQLGLLGIDLASEGPISRKQGSSYLFNYRFSTTSLATGNDVNLKYQDLSFKLNFPTKKFGTFAIWGLGLIDRHKEEITKQREEWETIADRSAGSNKLDKSVGGLTHTIFMNDNMYMRSSLAATYSNDHIYADQKTWKDEIIPMGDIRNTNWNIVFNSYLNTKISSKHVNRTGITVTGLKYDLDYKVSPDWGLDAPMERIAREDGSSLVLSAFSSSVIELNNYLTMSLGLTSQYFTLNKNWALEPRAALKWKINTQNSLAVSYGLHSRRERLEYYFVERNIEGRTLSNKYLDFSKAHHFAIAYDWNIKQDLRLKIEPYYQSLFHLPVEKNTSFSIINYKQYYLDRILENKGLGKNYGIDVTLEQFMKNGFYYMLTASLFKSRYKGGDAVWRNTSFDKGYMLNLLAGKEWMVGRLKQNQFSINARLFFMGGDRYSPIDEKASNEQRDIVFDRTKAFSQKFDPSLNGDVSVNYRVNKRKVSYEFSLKMLNVGMSTGMHFYEYDEKTNKVKRTKGTGMIPNISFKIYF